MFFETTCLVLICLVFRIVLSPFFFSFLFVCIFSVYDMGVYVIFGNLGDEEVNRGRIEKKQEEKGEK